MVRHCSAKHCKAVWQPNTQLTFFREQIEGDRAGSVVWLDGANYIYTLNKKTNGRSNLYFKCRENFCPAWAKMISREPPILTTAHNHDADELQVEVLRFKSELRHRSATENNSMTRIFSDLQLRYSAEAVAQIGGMKSMKPMMYRSRSKGTPQIPQNLTEYAAILKEDRWRERYATELGPDHGAFFQRLVVAEDQSTAVIFASPTILHYVNRGVQVDLHMDATFKIVPRKGVGSHLFAIHIHHDGTVYPVMYVLMERKTYAVYLAVLTVLRQLAPQINVRSVITDYEAALQEAIRVTFVGVELQSCWFHFARAVHNEAASIGLVRRNADDLSRRLVKMAMVLPLLPSHLTAQGLQELREVAGNRVEFDPFFVYLERWLPANISVFRHPQRTNNAVESFHRDLLRMVSREHPNIWVFTQCLQRMEHMNAVEFLRSLDAVALPHRPRYKYQRLNQKIHNAQNILERDGDVRKFLLHMTHAVGGLENILLAGIAHNGDADCQPQLQLAEPQFPEQQQQIPQPQPQEQPQNIPHPQPKEPQPQQPLPLLQPIAPRLRRRPLFQPYPDPQLPRPQILPPQQSHRPNSPPPLVFFRPN